MKFQAEAPADLLSMIKSDEGYAGRMYIDSEGFQTIGIGFCLDKTQIPEPVAEFWCAYIIDQLHNRLCNNFSVGRTYKQLDRVRQYAVLNMCYQMGVTGVCNFLNMWAALDTGDYKAAAEHALDSIWSTQTPQRARRVAGVLRDGNLKGYGVK